MRRPLRDLPGPARFQAAVDVLGVVPACAVDAWCETRGHQPEAEAATRASTRGTRRGAQPATASRAAP